ncbi:MAG: hypothetical protein ACQEV0_01835 [Bacillota bacterium]
MAQQKWLKVGAAAVLSAGMLAACGGDEDEPQMEQETDVLPGNEEEEDTDPEVELEEEDEMEEDSEY